MTQASKNLVVLRAPAKLNLSLEISARRADGYHELQSVMQKISLEDTLRVSRSSGIHIRTNLSYLPNDRRNLCFRAAEAYFRAAEIAGGVRVEIKKRIPVGAGLGGGSADAAAMLRALEQLYTPLSAQTRAAVAASLGADVPFCLSDANTAFCRGVGDRVSPFFRCRRTPFFIVYAKVGRKLSTADVYERFDRTGVLPDARPHAHDRLQQGLLSGDFAVVSDTLSNDFLPLLSAADPAYFAVTSRLLALGAAGVNLSGAGPVIYGLFAESASAAAALSVLSTDYPESGCAHFL